MPAAPPMTDRPRVLLIEDDAGVARVVKEKLDASGCDVAHVSSVAAGRQSLIVDKYDAVILDLTLPDGSGLDLASGARKAGNDVPILMLTAHDTVAERVEGFRRGADDYLCKPFDVSELTARLQAILRRSRAEDRHVLRYGDLELNLITRLVRRGQIETTLSVREAELLAYLLRHPEEVLRREKILEIVWGDETEDDSNVLNVYINYLRNKLDGALYPRIIHTVRGVGYILSQKEPANGM